MCGSQVTGLWDSGGGGWSCILRLTRVPFLATMKFPEHCQLSTKLRVSCEHCQVWPEFTPTQPPPQRNQTLLQPVFPGTRTPRHTPPTQNFLMRMQADVPTPARPSTQAPAQPPGTAQLRLCASDKLPPRRSATAGGPSRPGDGRTAAASGAGGSGAFSWLLGQGRRCLWAQHLGAGAQRGGRPGNSQPPSSPSHRAAVWGGPVQLAGLGGRS